METLDFKNNDKMPAIGLGTWKAKKNEVYYAVVTAIKNGYRHIDCAPIYGNEEEVGKAISDCIKSGIISRNDIWITSKLWNSAHRKENVLLALRKTLKDLQIDYLDLYLMHWPVALKSNVLYPKTANDLISLDRVPISETWKVMEESVNRGLVKHIGVSNFGEQMLINLMNNSLIKPELLQLESHPYLQQDCKLKFCKTNDILFTAYSPLGSSGNNEILRSNDLPKLLKNKVIREIADLHHSTPAQILISWGLNRGVSVIPKSVNKKRIIQNLKSEKIKLTKEDMRMISKLDKGIRFITGDTWVFKNGPYTINNLWE
jgi:alcohol dehydrogenase (NADP+)